MARSAKEENKDLKQYATKVDAKMKATLDFIVKVRKQEEGNYGQRELLTEMLDLYAAKHPRTMDKVDQLIELLGVES
jgi:hypothetical protein